MKRSLFFSMAVVALLLSVSFQKLAAQNTISGSPYWSLDGNANATTLSKLGTTNAINLRLFANNVERLHINYINGYVGIGTTAPTYKLHVANTANAIYGTTTGTTSTGVWGNSPYRGVYGAGATGVYGNASTTTGYGVYGHGGYYGVYGTGTLRGVWGATTNASGYGVYGQGSSTSPGKGVYGTGYYGVFGSGTYGVYGSGTYGTYGSGSSVGAYGIGGTYGVIGSGSSYGLYGASGSSAGNTGVYGTGYYGVHGVGVSGTSGGVYGEGATWGVYGSGPYGVKGYTTASTGTGVYGNGYYGVFGEASTFGVYGTSSYIGTYGISTGLAGLYAVGGSYGTYSYTSGTYGVFGSNGASSGGYGVYGYSGSTNGYGVYGEGYQGVYGHSTKSGGDAVHGFADGGGADYGGNFYSSTSVGVYSGTGNSSSYAGEFIGNVYTTGSYLPSDNKLKQNIVDVNNAMDIINKLRPKNYEYRQEGNYKLMNLPTGKQYGLIAQDVEQVLPDLIKETEFNTGKAQSKPQLAPQELTPEQVKAGVKPNIPEMAKQEKGEVVSFKAINYTELIPILVKALQEVNKKNEDLEARLKKLEDLVSKSSLVGNSYNMDAASLDQNTPNPFNSGTSIRYHLPQSIGSAKIVITDASGRTMKTMALTSRGAGEINLNTGTLAAGTYNYTLWVDGKMVDSRKMIIAK
jgi:hypothetical protein